MMRRKLLVVDDQPDIRRLIALTVEDDDCDVHEADDGDAGWQRVQALLPDLVLLDVMMPGIDGLELCRRMRAHPSLRRTPVIMLSARGTAEDIAAGKRAGANAYLVKPFSPLELLGVLGTLLDETGS